jgi:cytidine deaminase
LVAAHASAEARIISIAQKLAAEDLHRKQEFEYQNAARVIVTIDDKEADVYGQNTRETYPLADCFIDMNPPRGELAIGRFIDLAFGHPFSTPTPDEYAMYLASSAALRSSDDSRQVGAVIVDLTRDRRDRVTNADVIAVGMNEVPRGGGGFYWDQDSPDHRDQALLVRGVDRAKEIKTSALAELIDRIRFKGWLREGLAEDVRELALSLLPDVHGTQFMDVGEFGRPVHAEMAALIDGARRGVSVNGHSMYVTTFPCHNCAKHIIAAGIRRVVYLEPYPKSRASFLHGEEISLDPEDGGNPEGKVTFSAFSGVAPRKYREVFAMAERGAKAGYSIDSWGRSRLSLSPRYVLPNAAGAYLAGEHQALLSLPVEHYKWQSALPRPRSQSE